MTINTNFINNMFENKTYVGLKYCGGCKAQFDRVSAAKEIRDASPESVVFEPVRKERLYDYILVLSACSVQCADQINLQSKHGVCNVFSDESTARAIAEIHKLNAKKDD